jgi:hypothetical protein
MPYDEADPSDPMLLVGVDLPADEATLRESCAAFAEEFARMGYNEEQLMGLFRTPFYAGMHQVWQSLGDEAVRVVVQEAAGFWGRVRLHDRDVDPETGQVTLPVLNHFPSCAPASTGAGLENEKED